MKRSPQILYRDRKYIFLKRPEKYFLWLTSALVRPVRWRARAENYCIAI